MVCYTGCTFFDVPQLINLKQKEEVDARGGKPLNSSNKIHLVEISPLNQPRGGFPDHLSFMKWVGKWPFCRGKASPFHRGTIKGDVEMDLLLQNATYCASSKWAALRTPKRRTREGGYWTVATHSAIWSEHAKRETSILHEQDNCNISIIYLIDSHIYTYRTVCAYEIIWVWFMHLYVAEMSIYYKHVGYLHTWHHKSS